MKKKRLLSLLLVSALSVSMLSGCGKGEEGSKSNTTTSNKVEVKEEKAFETVPEDALIPKFIKTNYEKYDELVGDYGTFLETFLDNKESDKTQEFLDKYGISRDIESITDVSKINHDFYEGAITFAIAATYADDSKTAFIDSMIEEAQRYIATSLLNEENELKLAKEFEELNPTKYVQKYMKKNNIEVTNITYPNTMKTLSVGPAIVIELEFTFEGTQNGKKFSETKYYDFYFVASEDIRNGADARYTDNIELMAVTSSVFDSMKISTEKIKELYE